MQESSRNRRFAWGIVFTIPLFLFLFGSCGIVLNGRYYDVRQPGEAINQTSYEFNFSRSEVMAALDSCFTNKYYGRGGKESRIAIKGLRVYFWDGEIKLRTFYEPKNHYRSYVYRQKKSHERLTLAYSFLLEVDSLAPARTKVDVIYQRSSVYAGDYFLFNPRSLDFRIPRFLDLGSTTIEEYEVLLSLGKYLGQRGMPPIRYPRAVTFEEVQANFSIDHVRPLPFGEEDMLFGE